MDLRIFLLLVEVLEIILVSGHPLEREKRFLTPTTYPIPTINGNGYIPTIAITVKPNMGSVIVGNHPAPSHGSVGSQPQPVPPKCPIRTTRENRFTVLDEATMKLVYRELLAAISYAVQKLQNKMKLFPNMTQTDFNENKTSSELMPNKPTIELFKLHNRTNDSLPEVFNINAVETNINTKTEEDTTVSDMKSAIRSNMIKMKIKNRRMKRTTTNVAIDRSAVTKSSQAYCKYRGPNAATPDGYLHLCTQCALSTEFSSDIFPRQINEVDCDTTDCKCFTDKHSGTNHGKCQTVYKNVPMLRRRPGGCVHQTQTGQSIVVGEWEMIEQSIKVGCECVIDKRSVYAQLVPKT